MGAWVRSWCAHKSFRATSRVASRFRRACASSAGPFRCAPGRPHTLGKGRRGRIERVDISFLRSVVRSSCSVSSRGFCAKRFSACAFPWRAVGFRKMSAMRVSCACPSAGDLPGFAHARSSDCPQDPRVAGRAVGVGNGSQGVLPCGPDSEHLLPPGVLGRRRHSCRFRSGQAERRLHSRRRFGLGRGRLLRPAEDSQHRTSTASPRRGCASRSTTVARPCALHRAVC